ncbi:hypothetical protein ECE50_014770 [Chitinophaga sp. Mgbs1]|uniref:Uncharacterized protein n=1 Tax=Chitinophaga solisilvae TaxID=1233460 RepID=A0A9Q5CZT1_9BACT|nr:hypothetical protein [Chitinophaga solisilvae]
MKYSRVFLMYLLLAAIWCYLCFHLWAPVKSERLMFLLFSGAVYFSLVIWGLIMLFDRALKAKGYIILLAPVVAAMLLLLTMFNRDQATFYFGLGLSVAAMIALVTGLLAGSRRAKK